MTESQDIRIYPGDIPLSELYEMGGRLDGRDVVKMVVDLRTGELAAGSWLHYDAQEALRARGSRQEDLWGFSYCLDSDGVEAIEFDSRINQRPGEGNLSRGVQDRETRRRILSLLVSRIVI